MKSLENLRRNLLRKLSSLYESRLQSMQREQAEEDIRKLEKLIPECEESNRKIERGEWSYFPQEAMKYLEQAKQELPPISLKSEIGILQELSNDFDEQLEAMNARIDALSERVNTLIEESQQERQEFRKRQEKRQTAAVVREVTTNIFNN